MNSRYGIAAAQTLGVAGLLAVVYLAFLAPNSSDPLSGIEADGEIFEATPQTRDGADRRHDDHVERNTHRPDAVASTVDTTVASIPPSTGALVDTPTGFQYSPVVARILGQLAGGRP